MIELKNITKSYGAKKNVIDNINLKIENGEIFGFLGKNGAGKTTVIKMIVGILEADKGQILIDEKNINEEPIIAKQNIGYVSDNPNMFLKYKGIEYLNYMANIYGVSINERNERIEYLAKKFEIYDKLNRKIETYSNGMRQKIMIIGSILHKPNNWILDEPLTGLDPKAVHVLKEEMVNMAKNNKTVFLSTHILDIAEKLCDKIGIIHNGKLIKILDLQTTPRNLLEKIFMENVKDEK